MENVYEKTLVIAQGTKEEEKICKERRQKLKGFKELIKEEDGMGTVEIILIIVVLVGLVVVFKTQITEIVDSLFSRITTQTNRI